MQTEHHLELPRGLQIDFARVVQRITDERGGELTSAEILDSFQAHYLEQGGPYELLRYSLSSGAGGDQITALMRVDGVEEEVAGEGNGPIAALSDAFARRYGITVKVREYHEHAMSTGSDANAAAYIEADVDDEAWWGVGIHASIVTASLRAIVNAVDRAVTARGARPVEPVADAAP